MHNNVKHCGTANPSLLTAQPNQPAVNRVRVPRAGWQLVEGTVHSRGAWRKLGKGQSATPEMDAGRGGEGRGGDTEHEREHEHKHKLPKAHNIRIKNVETVHTSIIATTNHSLLND